MFFFHWTVCVRVENFVDGQLQVRPSLDTYGRPGRFLRGPHATDRTERPVSSAVDWRGWERPNEIFSRWRFCSLVPRKSDVLRTRTTILLGRFISVYLSQRFKNTSYRGKCESGCTKKYDFLTEILEPRDLNHHYNLL